MCRQIQQSSLINSSFECIYVNLSTSRGNDEVNKFSTVLLFRKGLRFISSFLSVLWQLLVHRPDTAYLAITCHGIGFLKDTPFVLLCKLFREEFTPVDYSDIVIERANSGNVDEILGFFNNTIEYKMLLPLVYRKTNIILLSWLLYDDIAAVVKREQVKICPNGIS